MDITQVKATISRGNQAARDGIDLTRGVRDRTEQAHTLAVGTVHDSGHKDVEAGLHKLLEALRESSRVAGLLHSGADAAQEYASRL
ncbi:hypothetical protein I0C86_00460 [Plantactinospora sp. S1510]|uniref:Uncharacterized protein n=1 Tax=Plantactinospora alkalitolerans TaxID=2789879 RepID=A0ABS0GMQ6_9ACTN|nr:hypothetical protein [Plantactinospora alkalitolerans]MBF9127474.1 hypothetical protein [Plantactinospora alkalitolerans]